MLPEILRRAAPGLLGTLAVVHGEALLVGKAVLGVIAKKFERLALAAFSAFSKPSTSAGVHQSSRLAKCACSGTLTSAGLAAASGGMP